MAVATTQAALAQPACEPCPFPTLITPLPSMWTIPIPVQSAASSYNLHQMFKCCSAAVGGLLYLFYCFRSCTCVCVCVKGVAGEEGL